MRTEGQWHGSAAGRSGQSKSECFASFWFLVFCFFHPRVRLCAFPQPLGFWTSPDRFTLRSIHFLLRAGILGKEEQNVLHNTVGVDHWEKLERHTGVTLFIDLWGCCSLLG